MNLFVDMDGVLADFAQHHQAVLGWRPDEEDEVDWAAGLGDAPRKADRE